MDIKEIRAQFPILSKKVKNKPLVYLDSSNSSQKPLSVLKSLDNFYKNEFSNIGRSIHSLAVSATNKFEETRNSVKKFINAKSKDEIIFTKNATESINLVATTFGQKHINKAYVQYICERNGGPVIMEPFPNPTGGPEALHQISPLLDDKVAANSILPILF